VTIATTPATAIVVPIKARRVGARLLKNAQSNNSTMTGTAVTISAAMPDGMPCCAQATKPLPTPDSNTPVSAAIFRSTFAMGCGSRQRTQAYITTPAIRKRDAPLMKGGISRMATTIAR
jgi:hypothetical protein